MPRWRGPAGRKRERGVRRRSSAAAATPTASHTRGAAAQHAQVQQPAGGSSGDSGSPCSLPSRWCASTGPPSQPGTCRRAQRQRPAERERGMEAPIPLARDRIQQCRRSAGDAWPTNPSGSNPSRLHSHPQMARAAACRPHSHPPVYTPPAAVLHPSAPAQPSVHLQADAAGVGGTPRSKHDLRAAGGWAWPGEWGTASDRLVVEARRERRARPLQIAPGACRHPLCTLPCVRPPARTR